MFKVQCRGSCRFQEKKTHTHTYKIKIIKPKYIYIYIKPIIYKY